MVVESVVDWVTASPIRIIGSVVTSAIGSVIASWFLLPLGGKAKRRMYDLLASGNSEESPSVNNFTERKKMQEAEKMLEGSFLIKENGKIVLEVPSQYTIGFRRLILYIFAARVAYDRGKRKTPKVNGREVHTLVEPYIFDDELLSQKERKGWIFIDHDVNDDFIEPSIELNRSKAIEVANFLRYG